MNENQRERSRRQRHRQRDASLAIGVCILLSVSASVRAAGGENTTSNTQGFEIRIQGLFQAADDLGSDRGAIDPKIIRSRSVTVDFDQVSGIEPSSGETVRFNLFDGRI